ncbi:hypothetical protein [Pyxidicoccus trucidator]|uniref:hypothetical protein n=1 Tax=Pyxidicoccus trucidator TaxID=2709662 RepID=UPI0019677F20|nr:hypothetical protein [Pyxidicoccus trucidator]
MSALHGAREQHGAGEAIAERQVAGCGEVEPRQGSREQHIVWRTSPTACGWWRRGEGRRTANANRETHADIDRFMATVGEVEVVRVRLLVARAEVLG